MTASLLAASRIGLGSVNEGRHFSGEPGHCKATRYNRAMTNTLLGGLSAEEFLAEYWQKKPLLVRQAVPGFTGVLSKDELFGLARDPDVAARSFGSAADGDGFVEENLWTGISRARSGCGAAIVGTPDQVIAKLRAYQDAGMEAFILSGYPHVNECDMFARYVLPQLQHGPLTL